MTMHRFCGPSQSGVYDSLKNFWLANPKLASVITLRSVEKFSPTALCHVARSEELSMVNTDGAASTWNSNSFAAVFLASRNDGPTGAPLTEKTPIMYGLEPR